MNTEWERILVQHKAIWRHDGEKRRPYALLTSGKISDNFVDCTRVMARPSVIKLAAEELASKLRTVIPESDLAKMVIVGQMKGSTTLASRVAEELDSFFMYTEKVGVTNEKRMRLDPRFDGIVDPWSQVVFVEDVTTTGSTTLASQIAVQEAGFTRFLPYILTLVNRSGSYDIENSLIISCLELNFPTWELGHNPHTEDGNELTPPVRPKSTEGKWLWADYP